MSDTQPVTLHGRTYQLPKKPTVIICVDGFDPEYLADGLAAGILPNMASLMRTGFHATAQCSMPSVTNANNVSIITGAPTSVHGIATNYFLDRATGAESMILDDSLMRGSTILAEMAARGVRVTAVTAKDKLRRILQRGLPPGSCLSTQLASEEVLAWLGRAARPEQYSADLSLCVLDAGTRMLRERRVDLLYLTLSDYVQHNHAPDAPEARAFMAAVDDAVGACLALGAVVGVTGDHGMSDKGGAPPLYVQDVLERAFGGPGCARVVCPIADPFVAHHGALGGFVRVYVPASHAAQVPAMVAHMRGFAEVETALEGAEAAARWEMPADREGDFVVVATEGAVLGAREAEHDLSGLEGRRLRSHGGLSEQDVPVLLSIPVKDGKKTREWKNYDIFDIALNSQ
ncbi:Phosphonoacetate hydrolase [Cordyceps fumosorosea ARSEF 2679]|uniref:Phosphonoacetate hydrolase n=1 Tax=Cordyceps fumosorosea (strain ARSEF 2679) TaxID=1081104 RepID=A0A167R2K2_CORFA|nr:Phosphonoacetate hydrolase [Cordyceps fumosorosea ARSEF 2679]OAA58215.1 Phosphonoacetate hydrolase [Cordyceps fumosorosea ARSEF 2679]